MARYKYDSLNRLVREDNKPMNKTVIFTYDTAGNITERCEYAYTSKDGEELSELACTHYSYDYEGDRLVSYNSESVAYNVLGNPTSYRGNATEWQYGNRLVKFGTTTFAYDGAGRRVSKGDISFTYDSVGRLIKQSDGLEFIYDNSGVIGVKYNNAQYFYRRDCQGNIIALIDNSGAVVVEYKYDAWGNHEAEVANEDYVTLAEINPFRYRGYYFDEETGLYFLQTRYYDPVVGRFISRDSIEYADPETICGLNLYAYCGNNPVMYSDPYGTTAWWEWLLGALVVVGLVAGSLLTGGVVAAVFAGAAIGAGLSYASQVISGELNWGQFALDIGLGAITGLFGASGITQVGAAIVSGAIGGFSSIVSDVISGKQVNIGKAIVSMTLNFIAGYFGGAGANNNANLAKLFLNGRNNNLMTNIIAVIKNGSKFVLSNMHNVFISAMKWFAVGTISTNIAVGGYLIEYK